ncbi:MAG: 3'-5' exonuclease [Paraglaciecola sp.]|uniref:3'-5' exonuclease n=1 Tax=Paraglaciecola sp. TaxID=1920173 RepID=UPI0032987EB7
MQRPSKEQINNLPLYAGLKLSDINIIETELDASHALKVLERESSIGFDTESKPIFKSGQSSSGPTLIQLATESRGFLFPVRFSAALSAAGIILCNQNIQKVGFGLKGDNKALCKLNINLANTLDLSLELKRLTGDKDPIGARAAVAMVLYKRLGKGAQRSNWGQYPLRQHQILYAANDAHCAICIKKSLVCY